MFIAASTVAKLNKLKNNVNIKIVCIQPRPRSLQAPCYSIIGVLTRARSGGLLCSCMLETFAQPRLENLTRSNMVAIAVGLPEQLSTNTLLRPRSVLVVHVLADTSRNCASGKVLNSSKTTAENSTPVNLNYV